MEPVIAVLPPHVIDQIAAGEVIERPASVVKELVDNAIDAGASAVAVEVTAGGRGVVRVTDDGCGMSARSAMLALERHATSKLRGVEDLWELATAGFRGEALPSIASVSRMTLTTRRAGDDAATRIAIDAGRVVSVSEVGAPVGTTIEVADLLYNMPARLKFLKGEATEASHITELVAKLAMAYPRLHVRLRHNGRIALDVPPDRDGFGRAQALLGSRVASRMVPVSGEESGVRVLAYLGAPELAQATARGVQLFVGRRPIRDRGLLHALAMGYGELVPRGRYPLAVVLLDLPSGTVDVNVHPQKLEVRFSDPAVVSAAVRHIVQAGVAAARWRDQTGAGGPVQLVGPIGATTASGLAPPALPFDGAGDAGAHVGGDGRAATRLAERHLAEMATRQMPLGFSRPDLGAPPPRRPMVPPAGSAPRGQTDARAWARSLREQNQAARVEEPRAAYRAESGAEMPPPAVPAAPWFPPAAGVPAARGEPSGAAVGDRAAIDAERAEADLEAPSGAVTHTPDQPASSDRTSAAVTDALYAVDSGAGAMDAAVVAAGAGAMDAAAGMGAAASIGAIAMAVNAGAPTAAGLTGLAGPIERTGFFAQLRYLGQLDLTYLVCEGDGELVLIDQHAAQERVELAKLRACHVRGGDARAPVQRMLFPATIDATPAQLALVGQVAALLAQVGFEVEPFGKATLAVKAVPAAIRHGDPVQLLRQILHDWTSAGALDDDDRLDSLLGTIACHSAVRAGDRLTASDAEILLRSLDSVDPGIAATAPAPHGESVLLRLPLTDLARRFGR